jgi:hypothetical protein
MKNIKKQGGGSEPSTARGVGETQQKSRESELNLPQQEEWLKKQGKQSEPVTSEEKKLG